MKSSIAVALSAAGLASAQAIIDFKVLHSEVPTLSSAKAIPPAVTNTASVVNSITSKLLAAHISDKPLTSLTTEKPLKPSSKPTKKTSSVKKTTKRKTTKTKKKPVKKVKAVKKHKHAGRHAPLHKRQTGQCAPQTILYNYVPSNSTPGGFLADLTLAGISQAALAPAGVTRSFAGERGSLYANSYLGYFQMASYNISQCAAFCTAYPGCTAINTYFERDPVLDPGATCKNPNPGTTARCALWGSTIDKSQALIIGEWRQDFMVVIQGSNGYTINTPPPAQANFTGPTALAGGITTSAGTSYITTSFQGGAYDVSFCSAACQSTNLLNYNTAVAALSSTYPACNYFNAFKVSYNGTVAGTYCKLYTDSSQTVNANAYTQVGSSGANYDLTYSYGYALTNNDTGVVPSAVLAAASASKAAAAASKTSGLAIPTQTPAQANLVASCSQINSTGTFIDSNNVTYTVKCSYDILNGGDIGNRGVSSFAACFAACDGVTGCQAIAYVGGSGAGTCYFKSLTKVTQQPNYNSAVDLAWLPGAYTAYNPSATSSSAKATATK